MSKQTVKRRVEILQARLRKARAEVELLQSQCPHRWKEVQRWVTGFDGYSTNYTVVSECELCLERRVR